MDIEDNYGSGGRSGATFDQPTSMQNVEERDLAFQFQNSMMLNDPKGGLKPKENINIGYFGGYITPEKKKASGHAGAKGYYQTTRPRMRKEKLKEDRFATPPRRPHCPTNEQMQFFLREQRDHNRHR